MHAHTNFSDGEYEPVELLDLAIDKRIKTFSITDHDTLGGIKDIRENHIDIVNKTCIELINGIELLKTIRAMISCGLDGIEVFRSSHSLDEMSDYMKTVQINKLYYTVGSDYHGPHVKPDIELASGKDNNLNFDHATLVKKISER